MRRQYLHLRKKGQALVEFALASTLIFFLLAAAVDLGMIFFALQGIHNAAQEGAQYGSRWLITDPATDKLTLNYTVIRERVRYEAGESGGTNFVNLLDLNNNDVRDDADPDINLEEYIEIRTLEDSDGNGDPLPENTPCDNPATTVVPCYVHITVRADYKPVFPLAPALGAEVPLRSSYTMLIRSSAAEGGEAEHGTEFQPGVGRGDV